MGEVKVFHQSLKNSKQEEITESNSRPAKRTKSAKILWEKNCKLTTPLPTSTPRPLEETQPQLCNYSLFNFFRLFYDEDVCLLIVTESERYVQTETRLTQSWTFFLARFSSVTKTSFHKRHCVGPTMKMLELRCADKRMSRHSFQLIKSIYILVTTITYHIIKLAKVRDYLQVMKRNFIQFGVFCHHLSFDEQMFPYYGQFSTKMFMQNKPVKFGMKIWFLTSSAEYSFFFQVYTGKDDSANGLLG